jgi:hypothetical protein
MSWFLENSSGDIGENIASAYHSARISPYSRNRIAPDYVSIIQESSLCDGDAAGADRNVHLSGDIPIARNGRQYQLRIDEYAGRR